MCGFVGALGVDAPVREAAELLRHRGPDQDGFLRAGPLTLGFRRLAIIDPQGPGQPVSDGTRALVFNGEIYNYMELARELGLESRSDSRVLFEALGRWGRGALDRLDGMFALAYWDGQSLLLARDRVGVKPLYYARLRDGWVFSSGTRPLIRLGVSDRLEPRSLDAYLTLLWAPSPLSPYQAIRKLPPGHLVTLPVGEARPWWRWEPRPGESTEQDVRQALELAVERELRSDVPLGIFLSGGLDSSLVAGLCKGGIPGFTLAPDPDDLALDIYQDERPHAMAVARSLGISLTEVPVSPSVDDIEGLVARMEEPVGDPASVAIHLLSRAAHGHVKTVLSGVGGDELFGGYPRHRALRLAMWTRKLPGFAQKLISVLPGREGKPGRLRRDAQKLLRARGDLASAYLSFFKYLTPEDKSRLYSADLALAGPGSWEQELKESFLSTPCKPLLRALSFDLNHFLPENNLLYTDLASMALSVEVRVPLLNANVLRAAAGLRESDIRNKRVLRKIAKDILPHQVIVRPKAGLGSPVRGWLRGRFRDWADSQLGLLPPELVHPGVARSWLEEEVTGKGFRYLALWALVTLSLWLRTR